MDATDKRKIGIIAVVVSALFCGMPGLAGLCFGSMAILGSFLPDSTTPPEDTAIAISLSLAMLALSVVFITVPVLIGVLTLWKKKPEIDLGNEPIPIDDF
jgi:hypothetical protein